MGRKSDRNKAVICKQHYQNIKSHIWKKHNWINHILILIALFLETPRSFYDDKGLQ